MYYAKTGCSGTPFARTFALVYICTYCLTVRTINWANSWTCKPHWLLALTLDISMHHILVHMCICRCGCITMYVRRYLAALVRVISCCQAICWTCSSYSQVAGQPPTWQDRWKEQMHCLQAITAIINILSDANESLAYSFIYMYKAVSTYIYRCVWCSFTFDCWNSIASG